MPTSSVRLELQVPAPCGHWGGSGVWQHWVVLSPPRRGRAAVQVIRLPTHVRWPVSVVQRSSTATAVARPLSDSTAA